MLIIVLFSSANSTGLSAQYSPSLGGSGMTRLVQVSPPTWRRHGTTMLRVIPRPNHSATRGGATSPRSRFSCLPLPSVHMSSTRLHPRTKILLVAQPLQSLILLPKSTTHPKPKILGNLMVTKYVQLT